jgi:hypothetical protein
MADCAHRDSAPEVVPCHACGAGLCDACRRQVRGAVYCEDCLAAGLGATRRPVEGPVPRGTVDVAPPKLPNPTLAAFAGVIPGVGACYNGQYQKGVLHVLMFPMLIGMIDAEDIFGFLVPVYFLYLVLDAYKTAVARLRHEPLPDYLGLRSLFGSAEQPISAAFGADLTETRDAAAETTAARPPLAAVVLIVLGVVLLFGNLGWFPRRSIGTFWPLVLVVIGIQQGRRRLRAHKAGS